MTTQVANPESKLYGLRYSLSYIQQLRQYKTEDLDFIDQAVFLAMWASHSQKFKSQLGQDLFALAMSGFRREGYFVEIGAHHGESLSNTWLLEKEYGWHGLLIEPNPLHESSLQGRRAKLIRKAAWHTSGEILKFHATNDSALSTLETASPGDSHDRTTFQTIEVESMTMNDILIAEGAPIEIDYLSLDIEGAELDVLQGLDLSKWQVKALTLEHNHNKERADEFDRILKTYGFARIFAEVSDFDAFYSKPEYIENWRGRYRDAISC